MPYGDGVDTPDTSAASGQAGNRPARIFVSYPSEYVAVAERLVADLRSKGHDVWWDVERIDIGDSIVAALNAGLSDAAFLVLCLGSSVRTSPWRDREWMSALARQLAGAHIKILPTLVTSEATIPAILADLARADLARNWEHGIGELDRALRR